MKNISKYCLSFLLPKVKCTARLWRNRARKKATAVHQWLADYSLVCRWSGIDEALCSRCVAAGVGWHTNAVWQRPSDEEKHPSGNSAKQFLLVPHQVVFGSQEAHGFGSRSWVKMSSPPCGSANYWPQLISSRTIRHIYVAWASTADASADPAPKTHPASANATRTPCSSLTLEQCVYRIKWKRKCFTVFLENEGFRFGWVNIHLSLNKSQESAWTS